MACTKCSSCQWKKGDIYPSWVLELFLGEAKQEAEKGEGAAEAAVDKGPRILLLYPMLP